MARGGFFGRVIDALNSLRKGVTKAVTQGRTLPTEEPLPPSEDEGEEPIWVPPPPTRSDIDAIDSIRRGEEPESLGGEDFGGEEEKPTLNEEEEEHRYRVHHIDRHGRVLEQNVIREDEEGGELTREDFEDGFDATAPGKNDISIIVTGVYGKECPGKNPMSMSSSYRFNRGEYEDALSNPENRTATDVVNSMLASRPEGYEWQHVERIGFVNR